MGKERFVVRPVYNGWDRYNELVDTKYDRVVGTDRMEPEDVSFFRELAWVVDLLNRLADPTTDR